MSEVDPRESVREDVLRRMRDELYRDMAGLPLGKSPDELNSNEGGKEMTEKKGNSTDTPGIPTPAPSMLEPKREETISEKLEDIHTQTIDLCQISYSIAAKLLPDGEEKPTDDTECESILGKVQIIRDNIRMVQGVLTEIDQRL